MNKTSRPNINLFIVGAAKSGTTSLYNYLNQVPSIYFPKVKELNYYADVEANDKEAYKPPKPGVFYHQKVIRNEEVYFSLFEDAQQNKVLADCSPSYLWDLDAAGRISRDFPNANIVMILRNPTDRAFSHYLMDVKTGNQNETDFYKALQKDKKAQPKTWGTTAHLYEELGHYSKQIQPYFEHFPREQIKVVIYESFFADKTQGVKELLEFIDLEPSLVAHVDFSQSFNTYSAPKGKMSRIILQNKRHVSRLKTMLPSSIRRKLKSSLVKTDTEKPIMPQDAMQYLENVYSSEIQELETLLDKDLSVWKR